MKDRILRAIRFSALAYRDPDEVGEYLKQLGMSYYTPFCNVDSDVQGFACMDDFYDTFWISIRGTEFDNVKDWLTNLDCRRVTCHYGDTHKGFYEDAMSVRSEVLELVRWALERGKRVCFTGHSQGGAVALQLFASIMPELYDNNHITCIPVEAPRGFTEGAATYLGCKYGDHIYPIRHNNDIVVRMPPKSMGYRHVPGTHLQYIDRKGKVHQGIGFWRKLVDSFLGLMDDLGTPGLDCLKDHDVNRIADIWWESMRPK